MDATWNDRIPGLLAIWPHPDHCGHYRTRTSAVCEVDGVRHYYGLGRDNETWPVYLLPDTGVDYVDGTDPTAVERELRVHDVRRVGIDWLVSHGYSRHVRSRPFNSLTRGQNIIRFQYDHPGVIPIGTEMTWEIECGGYTGSHSCHVG